MDCPENSCKNRTVLELEGWSYWDQSFPLFFSTFSYLLTACPCLRVSMIVTFMFSICWII